MINWIKILFKPKFRFVTKRDSVVDRWYYFTETKMVGLDWYYVSGTLSYDKDEAYRRYQEAIKQNGKCNMQVIESTET